MCSPRSTLRRERIWFSCTSFVWSIPAWACMSEEKTRMYQPRSSGIGLGSISLTPCSDVSWISIARRRHPPITAGP